MIDTESQNGQLWKDKSAFRGTIIYQLWVNGQLTELSNSNKIIRDCKNLINLARWPTCVLLYL